MRICPTTLPQIANYAHSGRVVVFDTETTGGSCSDEICQLAEMRRRNLFRSEPRRRRPAGRASGRAEYVSGSLQRTMNVYIRPTCEMNPWAEEIHGLSMDFLEENGIDPVDALNQFFSFLGSDVLLVAHNNRFDMGMLQRECAKFDVIFEPEHVETCDALALSRYCRPDLKSHALGNLLEPLGVAGVNSHDALDDVMACAGVFFRLVREQTTSSSF